MGAIGGLAPDLDVFIRSASDPLLNIEYHRHFTHSLAFVPIGGALASLPWMLFERFRKHAAWTIGLTTLGYATHGVLDSFTTYGTLLLWPFSDYRVSWHIISVIDPLFTLPLLALVLISARRQSRKAMLGGCIYAAAYLLFGLSQQVRASQAQAQLAERRGHTPERAVVLPSFANNVTWRGLYESGSNTYIDKIRVTWTGRTCVSSGATVPRVPPMDYDTLSPPVARGERLLRWFASGWIGCWLDDTAMPDWDEIEETLQKVKASGVTILLVEQAVSMALRVADRAYVLEAGTMVLEGPSAELAQADSVRNAYLGF